MKRTLQSTFAALRFSTPSGEVDGSSLKVVKVSRQGMPLVCDEVFAAQVDLVPSDAFWYCVGPGHSYFLAVPIVTAGFDRVRVQWIVRPLTEQRFRGALVGDKEALRLAFGPDAA